MSTFGCGFNRFAMSNRVWIKMVLEPKAMDLLKATSARLAAAKSVSFTASVGYEFPSKADGTERLGE